ncbi:SPOR domain-containing protein [Alkalimarinus sediminis]|uniref:SPOR domain-containing protein n=1 Tax=Alkalimarinus sediminis TaxID=1632866 RepID=A0A9E8HKL9_9ALTE|nr:SPOR domain-containing protein [Alkalimarinus sediminis]UZW76060.1 SPOR domain-containing protein [Alkalimarinus sediminis]
MDGLKQRVVGALVIVSLAVIFLPMIFDEPHQPSKTQLIPIPVQSELPVITINSPQKPDFKIIEGADEAQANSERQGVQPQKSSTDSPDASSEANVSHSASNEAESSKKPANVSTEKQNDVAVKDGAEIKSSSIDAKKSNVEKSDKATSVFQEKALSNVWMVQLGTFGNHKNAYNLRDSLRKDGFDGHTTKVDKDGKQLVRVFSGPYADKTHADKVKKQLDKKYKLNTLVVHFK